MLLCLCLKITVLTWLNLNGVFSRELLEAESIRLQLPGWLLSCGFSRSSILIRMFIRMFDDELVGQRSQERESLLNASSDGGVGGADQTTENNNLSQSNNNGAVLNDKAGESY